MLYRGTCILSNGDSRDCAVSNFKDLPSNVVVAGLGTLEAALAGDMVLTLVLSNTLILLDTNFD